MIIKYHEQSEVVTIHSDKHAVCTHEVEDGWQCCCSDCRCESVIQVHAAYAYNEKNDHEVIINVNPGHYSGAAMIALTADVARALAAALNFAAIDAETLNREFPSDNPAIQEWSEDTYDHYPSTEDADGF